MRGHRQIGVWYQRIGQITEWSKTDRELGKVQCECGVTSENLPDSTARDAWHKQHIQFERESANNRASRKPNAH